jgi:hypothetical protein
MHFMSVLAAQSGNLNFLEGCYHAFMPYNAVRIFEPCPGQMGEKQLCYA